MTAIAKIETILVRLPTRRTHKWTGLTEPIGQYLLVKMTGTDGTVGWDEAVSEVRKVAQDGIRTIKIKIGVDPARDVAIVKAIREAVGPQIKLCVDANEGYKTPGQAIQTIREMESVGLIYVEQPVMGIERIARVAQAIDAPVMADESAWNAHDVIQIVEQKAAQIVSIYTTKPGGLYKAMQVSAVCEAAGIICNVNGSVETGIGNLANVHLAAAAPAATLSNVIPVSMAAEHQKGRIGGIYYADDLLVEPMQFVDGGIRVPTEPGMGIAVDEAKGERYKGEA